MKAPILNGIFKHLKDEKINFSMPSHKERVKVETRLLSKLDVKIKNLKNDGENQSILKYGEKVMSGIFACDNSFYFTNGKLGCTMALFSTLCKPGDKIIVDPECDKTIMDAITLLALIPVFIKRGNIKNSKISQSITSDDLTYLTERHHDAKMIVIASPTYYGVCSDIKTLSDISKDAKMLIVVDESWGAHFNFSKRFPKSALSLGADIVIQDLSKTLGAFSHSGIIHINTNKIYIPDFKEKLDVYSQNQISAPYVCLMEGSILYAFKNSKKYNYLLKEIERGRYLISKFTDIKWISAEEIYGEDNLFDETKIILNLSKVSISPYEMATILKNRFSVICDYYDDEIIVFQVSIYNTPSEIRRFISAILSLSKNILPKITLEESTEEKPKRRKVELLPYNAFSCEGEKIDIEISEGRLSKNSVYKIANDSLILAPGEKITKKHIDEINMLLNSNQDVYAISDGKIDVLSLGDSF